MLALCSTAVVGGKVATALLVNAATPMSFCCSSYSPAGWQKCSTTTCLGTCASPLQHCCCQWEGGNSLACHCSYTYEFLQFLQPCRMAEVQHNNLPRNLC